MQKNSPGPAVLALQKTLMNLGYAPGFCDGIYGLQTQAAVMAFQRSASLTVDGIAGPQTLDALSKSDSTASVHAASMPVITDKVVIQMFPGAPSQNININ